MPSPEQEGMPNPSELPPLDTEAVEAIEMHYNAIRETLGMSPLPPAEEMSEKLADPANRRNLVGNLQSAYKQRFGKDFIWTATPGKEVQVDVKDWSKVDPQGEQWVHDILCELISTLGLEAEVKQRQEREKLDSARAHFVTQAGAELDQAIERQRREKDAWMRLRQEESGKREAIFDAFVNKHAEEVKNRALQVIKEEGEEWKEAVGKAVDELMNSDDDQVKTELQDIVELYSEVEEENPHFSEFSGTDKLKFRINAILLRKFRDDEAFMEQVKPKPTGFLDKLREGWKGLFGSG